MFGDDRPTVDKYGYKPLNAMVEDMAKLRTMAENVAAGEEDVQGMNYFGEVKLFFEGIDGEDGREVRIICDINAIITIPMNTLGAVDDDGTLADTEANQNLQSLIRQALEPVADVEELTFHKQDEPPSGYDRYVTANPIPVDDL